MRNFTQLIFQKISYQLIVSNCYDFKQFVTGTVTYKYFNHYQH